MANESFTPKHLGHKVQQFQTPSKEILDTFQNPGVHSVTFQTDEMTSLCPKTGQPDWEEVSIVYQPDEKCLESKSLKLYLQSYRNEAAFMEELSTRIWNDLYAVLSPFYLAVTVTCSPRGGIALRAFKEGYKSA